MILLILIVLLSAHSLNAQISVNSFEEIFDSFNTVRLIKTLAANDSSQCQIDFQTILNDAGNGSTYALQILDASAKIPDGILVGNHAYLGQFYECLRAEHPAGRFVGKYCSLTIDSPLSVGNPFMRYAFGFCVPSSCSASDLNKGLKNITFLSLYADDEYCHSSLDEIELQDIDWIAISLIIVIGCLAIASTTYECWQIFKLKNDKPNPLLTSFSIYRNGKTLFEVTERGGGKMDCLNGIRTISMLWVILCHVSLLMVNGNVVNLFDALEAVTDRDNVVISNGYLSVDSFFFLSGLLVAFVFFRDIGRSGSYDVPRSYINRYIRLTPPYAMIILMQVTLVNYMGDGPSWGLSFLNNDCINNWWTGLLYVQNIVNPNNQCLIQTWYLSADMQLYVLAPILLYILFLWPVYGGIAGAIITVAAAFWSFGIGLIYELPYDPLLDQSGVENSVDNYVPWARASPYLVGVMLGFIICGLQAKKIEVKLKPWHVFVGWFISFALLGSCMFGMLWFLDNPEDVTVAESAAFLAFHRFGWALALAWMVFACIHGYGGPINTFLSWSPFQVLGRMSYCVYLVHLTVIIVVTASQKTPMYFDLGSLIFLFVPIAVYSHIAAIPLTILVELPFCNLDRYYLRSIKILPLPKAKPKIIVGRNKGEATVTQVKEMEEAQPDGGESYQKKEIQ